MFISAKKERVFTPKVRDGVMNSGGGGAGERWSGGRRWGDYCGSPSLLRAVVELTD